MQADAYGDYVARFEAKIGSREVGAYGKWQGQLIRKLSPDEFAAKHGEFTHLRDHYERSLARGDTLSDALLKLLRERKTELLIEEELPMPPE
jgi:hypothetical protein